MSKQKKEIDFVQSWSILCQNRKKISIVTGVAFLIAILYCIFATPIFMARAIINPPKLTDAGTSFSQVISGLSALSGGNGGLLQKTDADISIAILKTDYVSNLVINKFNLIKVFNADDIVKAQMSLSGSVKFVPDVKSGFVQIEVNNKDPKLAADIANYYTVALGQSINNIAYARASQRVLFYQRQLESATASLNAAEDSLRKFSESNGILAGQQAQVIANISAQLQTQLVSAQIQLRNMAYYAGSDNADYKNLQAKVDSIKKQLEQLSSQNVDNVSIPVGLAPSLASQYIRLMRDFQFKQVVYEVMMKQSKAAQLDAQSEMEPLAIQVVDPAQIPLYKAKPKRLYILIIVFILSFIISSFVILFKHRGIILRDIRE